MRISPKFTVLFILLVAGTAATSFAISESYSITNPLDFAGIMKQDDGYTTITASGESSSTLQPDSAVMVLSLVNPPADLQDALDAYNNDVTSISEELKQELESFDDVSISYIQTNFDGNRYRYSGSADDIDSYVAYMSFPIKVDMIGYENISQKISELGLRVDDIRISRVSIEDKISETDNETKEDIKPVRVSIPYGTSVPNCEVTNECFLPTELTIDAGTEVMWSNDDEAAHTVTSGSANDGPDGVFDSALLMAGSEFSFVFNAPGEYPYFCLVHPWMTGSVTVKGDANQDLEYKLEATINVRLETKPDTLENTLSEYTNTLDELSALLEENGASGEIPRSTININPSRYERGTFDTYQTYTRWTVKTTLDNMEEVYDILSKYGGIERLYLTHSKSSIDSVRQEMTQEALDEARKNVLGIIEPMNLEIKGVKTIKINQEFGEERVGPQYRYSGVLVSYDDWNNVRDGNISVVVDVEFEVGQR